MSSALSDRPVVPRHKGRVESAAPLSAARRQGRGISFLILFVFLVSFGLLIGILYKRRVLQRMLWPRIVEFFEVMGGEGQFSWKSIASSLAPFVTRQMQPAPMWGETSSATASEIPRVEWSAPALSSMTGIPLQETEPYRTDPVTDKLPAISAVEPASAEGEEPTLIYSREPSTASVAPAISDQVGPVLSDLPATSSEAPWQASSQLEEEAHLGSAIEPGSTINREPTEQQAEPVMLTGEEPTLRRADLLRLMGGAEPLVPEEEATLASDRMAGTSSPLESPTEVEAKPMPPTPTVHQESTAPMMAEQTVPWPAPLLPPPLPVSFPLPSQPVQVAEASPAGPLRRGRRVARRSSFPRILVVLLILLLVLVGLGAGAFYGLHFFNHPTASVPGPGVAAVTPTVALPTPTPIPTVMPTPTAVYPVLAGSYNGTIVDIPANVSSGLSLTNIRQNGMVISGFLTIGPKLHGGGPFTGTVDAMKHLQFTMTDSAGHPLLFFEGAVQSKTSLSGDYYRCNAGQGTSCIRGTTGYGIWNVTQA